MAENNYVQLSVKVAKDKGLSTPLGLVKKLITDNKMSAIFIDRATYDAMSASTRGRPAGESWIREQVTLWGVSEDEAREKYEQKQALDEKKKSANKRKRTAAKR